MITSELGEGPRYRLTVIYQSDITFMGEMGRTMTEIVAYGTARIVETITDAPDSVSAQG